MDLEVPRPDEAARVVGYLRFVNRWLGGTSAVMHHLRCAPGPITVLDVGSGAGDIAKDLARHLPHVRPIAFDLSLWILRFARGLPRVLGDVGLFPFRDESVDWIITTHFFHHLTDDEIVSALREFGRVARRGVIVNDLARRRRAVLWIRLFTLFANRFAKADGPQSVRRGFTAAELEAFARRAGLSWLRVTSHFGHRLTLAGEKVSDGLRVAHRLEDGLGVIPRPPRH